MEHQQNSVKKLPVTLESGEKVVTVIKRHSFGLVTIYLQAVAALGALFLLAALVGIDLFQGLSEESLTLSAIAFLLVSLTVFMLFVITSMYWQTKLLVTNRGIVQILQNGLFNRKVSRLSMADIEDVTAEQKGLFQTLFNYGNLHIETSGEIRNFDFNYCPHPNKYASQIIDARHVRATED